MLDCCNAISRSWPIGNICEISCAWSPFIKKTIKKKSTIGTAILFPISRKMKAKKKGNRHIANCEAITITTMPMLANAPLVTNVPIMLCNNSGKDRITMQAIWWTTSFANSIFPRRCPALIYDCMFFCQNHFQQTGQKRWLWGNIGLAYCISKQRKGWMFPQRYPVTTHYLKGD